MIRMHSQQLINLFPQQKTLLDDFDFHGVQIDSRQQCEDCLFIAIKGENFDGHEFVDVAWNKGAKAAIVERRLDSSIPQILVADCKQALAHLAKVWRLQVNPLVTAITGSNGKTTVKEMLAKILSSQQQTSKTAGNLNNELGVPLTLLRLDKQDRYAIIEMGANHLEEIRFLVSIAQPDIVYVNNAQSAHVEGFGSLQNVIKAKGEMYQYCNKDAYAVFNDDEDAVDYWRSIAATSRHLIFSSRHSADVAGSFENTERGLSVCFSYLEKQACCHLDVLGDHNAQNALAAVTLALANGLKLEQAVTGLDGFNGVQGRQQKLSGINGSLIIDDSYNANPGSLSSAIKVLCALPGKPWLALGDMAELGDDALCMHQQAVKEARQAGVEKFFALGEYACHASALFEADGFCFSSHDQMAQYLLQHLTRDTNLLVKGSRSAHMEKLVAALVNDSSNHEMSGEKHAV